MVDKAYVKIGLSLDLDAVKVARDLPKGGNPAPPECGVKVVPMLLLSGGRVIECETWEKFAEVAQQAADLVLEDKL